MYLKYVRSSISDDQKGDFFAKVCAFRPVINVCCAGVRVGDSARVSCRGRQRRAAQALQHRHHRLQTLARGVRYQPRLHI